MQAILFRATEPIDTGTCSGIIEAGEMGYRMKCWCGETLTTCKLEAQQFSIWCKECKCELAIDITEQEDGLVTEISVISPPEKRQRTEGGSSGSAELPPMFIPSAEHEVGPVDMEDLGRFTCTECGDERIRLTRAAGDVCHDCLTRAD